MKVARTRSKSEAGRGCYARRACNHCRRRKSKCDGQEPICGPCSISGHECTWDHESAKKPSTKQYVDLLKNRIKVLEMNVKVLEEELAHHRGGGGVKEDGTPESEGMAMSPLDVKTPEDMVEEEEEDPEGDNGGDPDLDCLCAATKQLVLQDDDLHVYGPTSAYRLSPNDPPTSSRGSNGARAATYAPTDYPSIPDDAWRRHLPASVPLTREEHDHVLDLLFKFFTSWCMRIVPELFLRDMHSSLSQPAPGPKTPHYSPMLHNALLALALAFSSDEQLKDVRTRRLFADKAKADIERECERPNISVVHALSLIGSFHSTQGDRTLGYMYFGISGRMSQALGLNIDCSPWVKSGLITDSDMLARNWAYWTTFCQDVCWSLHVGREFCVAEPSEKQKIPIPFVDTELDQILWRCPEPFRVPTQPSYLSSTFKAGCELLRIARRVMELLHGLNAKTRYETNLKLISEIDLQLNAWKDNLPKEVDLTASSRLTALPHRLMLHLAYWWLFILLHRPFYRRGRPSYGQAKDDLDHVKLCDSAANEILRILDTWSSLYTLRLVPITLIQVIFAAGTIFVLSSLQASSRPRLAEVALSKSLGKAETCIQYLLETGKSWEVGNQVASILSGTLYRQLQERMAMRTMSTGLTKSPLSVGIPRVRSSPGSSSKGSASPPSSSSQRGTSRSTIKVSTTFPDDQNLSHSPVGPFGSFTTDSDAAFPQVNVPGSTWSFLPGTVITGSSTDSTDPLFQYPVSSSSMALKVEDSPWVGNRELDMNMGLGMIGGQGLSRMPYTTGFSPGGYGFDDSLPSFGPSQQWSPVTGNEQRVEFNSDEAVLLEQYLQQQSWALPPSH